MSAKFTAARQRDLKLTPQARLAKQILEVMADGHPCEYRFADNPKVCAGMVIAKVRNGKRMGVMYNKAKAVSGSDAVEGMLYKCTIRHQEFKTTALISMADLAIEHQRKMFAASLGQRMIENPNGSEWSGMSKN